MKIKKVFTLALVSMLLFTACSKNSDSGHGSTTDTDKLKAATTATYPVGTKVILKTDHMDGMSDAKGTVSGVYDTTVYAVDYTDADTGKEVKNHKWVIQEELKDSEGKTYNVGDEVSLNTGHMSGMGGEGQKATITEVVNGPVYMVDYTPTTGGSLVKNHQWVIESELEADKGD